MVDVPGRVGRRAFLASSAGVATGVAVAGTFAGTSAASDAAEARAVRTSAPRVGRPVAGELVARGLTVNGLVDPIGVDPDDCMFAWKLSATGRHATQSGFRIVVQRRDPGEQKGAWDSGAVVSGRQAFVGYGGAHLAADAAYEWTVQVQNASGTWGPMSLPASFVTGLRASDWQASWLRPAAGSEQPDRITYVRTEVEPPMGQLRRATAFVSAAHTYRLFVDGKPVDAWPSFSYPDEQYARAVDLTGLLQGGRRSAIGLLHRWYGAGKGRPASAPGLLVQLSLHYEDGRHLVIGSDGTWRELASEWLPSPQRNSDACDFVEWVDGRAHPVGWDVVGYDDSAWTPVRVLGPPGSAPFTNTYAQRTQITEYAVTPVSVHRLASGAVVADFGAVYPARIRVRFTTGESGRTVPMHVGYLLDPDGSVSTTHGTQGTNLSFSYIQRDGAQTFEAFWHLGFRYVQIDGPGEAIGADQVLALVRHAAMPDVPMATFASGDRVLDAVWRLNARSCLLCCHEQFVDTPTREKAQFLWDAANESEAVMRTYGEQNLSWQGLRDVARGQARFWPDGRVNVVYPYGFGARDIPTFTERYPEWLWRYYVSTGDAATVETLYPSVVRVAEYLWGTRQTSTGLLYGLADVPEGDPTYGYDLSVAADTVSNVLAVNAFTRIAQLADLVADAPGAATQRSRAAQLAASVNALLARADGTYVDGVDADGTPSRHASQEANALALAYRVVPADHVEAVGAYVASLAVDVGPNHGLELLRGLAAAARPTDMVRVLTDATRIGWAQILARGGTFTWETWTPSDLIGDSMSHGWGSSAIVAMQETLLGVALDPPSADGTVRAMVAPPGTGLQRASGSIPTVAGPLSVSWQRRGQGVTLSLVVPANASATVSLPATDPAGVREGGMPAGRSVGVTVLSPTGGRAKLTVGSGSYRFTTS